MGKYIEGEFVKEIEGAELINSNRNSSLVPRWNHKCVYLVDLHKFAEDKEGEAKERAE